MKYPKLREIKGAVGALLTKPFTTAFPKKAHTPMLTYRGKPYFHDEKCIGCTACVNVCPAFALTFEDYSHEKGAFRRLTINWDTCIECGQCQLHCPTEEGIVLSQEYDISTTESRTELTQSIEKEMVLCEGCHKPIACYDHFAWTVKKLGPLSVSNTTLITFIHNSLSVNDSLPKEEVEFFRSDRFRILCPLCRREAVIKS